MATPAAFAARDERLDDRRAAADRLDARRTLGEIIGRLMEFDAVALDPGDRRRRFRREPREIGLVALEFRRLQHVVDEARLDALGRRHPHVGRRPARVAAGLVFRRLLQQRDVDGDAAAARLAGRGQSRRKPRGAMADDDEIGCHGQLSGSNCRAGAIVTGGRTPLGDVIALCKGDDVGARQRRLAAHAGGVDPHAGAPHQARRRGNLAQFRHHDVADLRVRREQLGEIFGDQLAVVEARSRGLLRRRDARHAGER